MAKKTSKKSWSVEYLEKKFDETAFRLSQERNDFLLPQVVDFVRGKKWLNLRPEYQRRLVWDAGKRSRFIESLLLNVPVPPVFLYEWELGRYEVMDGQQRLNAVVEFYENGFALTNLDRWKELHGMRYRELPETLQRGLDRRRLSATVLLVDRRQGVESRHDDIRKLVFNRLNTGGQQLNDQELRNCLFEGPFNQLLISLAKETAFQRAWDIPVYEEHSDSAGRVLEPLASNRLYRRMLDCEIVLRFFAFRERTRVRGSVKTMLDRCMEDNLDPSPEHLDELGQVFRDRLRVATELFGDKAFRYKDNKGRWRLSQPLYDAVMIAVDRLWSEQEHLLARKSEVRKALRELLEQPDAFEVIVGKPNTARAILRRVNLVQAALRSA